jgi:hypothetical protein
MKKIILRIIAYLQIIVVCLFFFGLFRIKGTIVYPAFYKAVLYTFLALLSSIGIIFNKKIPFLSTVYLYTFLTIERVERVFSILNSEKVNFKPDNLQHFYLSEIISSGILMSLYVGVILLVLSKDVRAGYQTEKNQFYLHLISATVAAFYVVLTY